MRILYLSQVVPYPLDSGAKVREYYLLQYLAAHHQVTLVCFGRASDRPEALAHMREICHEVHMVPMHRSRISDALNFGRSLLIQQPLTILRDERTEMSRMLADIIRHNSYNAIHADQLSMAQYALWVKQNLMQEHHLNPKMVLDAHNAYYLIPRRMAEVSRNPVTRLILRREAHMIARYEAEVYREFDHILTVTNEDLTCIKRIMPTLDAKPRFSVIPICVDANMPALERDPDAQGILLLGGLHWPPNADAARWFIREIWPHVRAEVPHARLFIVGARPPNDILAFGNCAGIDQPEKAGTAPIVVTDYVKDPGPFIRASAVLAVALRSGGGMRVKIVEAMQWGLPIVSTSIGCEGIEVTPGLDMLVADEPAAFAQSLIKVLRDREVAKKLTEGGHHLVTQHFDWHKVYTSIDKIYQPDAQIIHA